MSKLPCLILYPKHHFGFYVTDFQSRLFHPKVGIHFSYSNDVLNSPFHLRLQLPSVSQLSREMWEPRRLTTLWASTASYSDSFSFLLVHVIIYINNNIPGYVT
jgi:hypothetical protein